MIATLETQPYTTIIDLGYTKLIKYAHDNFLTYIDNNIKTKQLLRDREDLILDMLSRVMTEQEYWTAIIEIEQFQAQDITLFFGENIKDEPKAVQAIWDALLQHKKLN